MNDNQNKRGDAKRKRKVGKGMGDSRKKARS